jgi:TonB family protein
MKRRDQTLPSWILLASLTLLLHALCLEIPYSWNASPEPQVKIERIDSNLLKWIKKNKKLSPELKDPGNEPQERTSAEYFSDRNRHVPRQQKTLGTQSVFSGKAASQPEKRNLRQFALPLHLNTQASPPQESPTEPQLAQAYLDDPLPVGAETLLNTQENIHYSFFSRIRSSLAAIWFPCIHQILSQKGDLLAPGDYVTAITSTLDDQGNLLSIHILHSSGTPDFDQALLHAFEKAHPFVPPPQALLDERRQITIPWASKVQFSKTAGWSFHSPNRIY